MPQNLTAQATAVQVTLSWTNDSPHPLRVLGPTTVDLPAGVTSYTATGLEPNTNYTFDVVNTEVAVVAGSNAGPVNVSTLAPPPPPSQLTAPLDSAICFYRPAPGASVPNLGTRPEPFELSGPVYTADAALGAYWHYSPTRNDAAVVPLPPAIINGDVTFALRLRPEAAWTWRTFLAIIDDSPLLKHCMIGIDTSNKWLSRFWDASPTHAQIVAQSTTTTLATRTDTLVVTWDSATRAHKLYMNGVLEATAVANAARSATTVSPLQVPNAATTLKPAGKLFALAVWDRPLSAAEVAALAVNAEWLAPVV